MKLLISISAIILAVSALHPAVKELTQLGNDGSNSTNHSTTPKKLTKKVVKKTSVPDKKVTKKDVAKKIASSATRIAKKDDLKAN